jgi:hypothetical protein
MATNARFVGLIMLLLWLGAGRAEFASPRANAAA